MNVSSHTLDLEGLVIRDSTEARHTFPAATLNPGCAAVVFGGGSPSAVAGEIVETASSGKLDLSDGGDTVTVRTEPQVITDETFAPVGENESLTLPGTSPSFYFKHSAVSGEHRRFLAGAAPRRHRLLLDRVDGQPQPVLKAGLGLPAQLAFGAAPVD